MAGQVRAGKVGSIKELRKSIKKGSGTFIENIPADAALEVRFITEPDEWLQFFEHYDAIRKFYPCTDDCEGCEAGETPSRRWLANVLLIEDQKVVPLKMPKTLVDDLIVAYDKFKTMMDRDYELSRTGSGKNDTTYKALALGPVKRNLARYTPYDLLTILQGKSDEAEAAGADDDEDDEPPAKTARRPLKKTATKSRAVVEDDEDEDDDEDEAVEELPVRRVAKKVARKPLSGAGGRRVVRRK